MRDIVVIIHIHSVIAIQVNNLIDSFGGDRASIVLVVTDGQLQDVTEATHQVSKALFFLSHDSVNYISVCSISSLDC